MAQAREGGFNFLSDGGDMFSGGSSGIRDLAPSGSGGNQYFGSYPTMTPHQNMGIPMSSPDAGRFGMSVADGGGVGRGGGGQPRGIPPGQPNTGAAPGSWPSNAPFLTNLGGGYGTYSPFAPGLTANYINWLTQQIGQGAPGYPGSVNAGINPLLSSLQSAYQQGPMSMPGMGGLAEMAQTGDPTSYGPVWQSMVDSMQRQIGQGAAALKEQFNFAGDPQSSPFGSAMTDYYTQSNKDLNAMLMQGTQQAQEAAAGRKLAAGEALPQEALGFMGQGAQLGGQMQDISQQDVTRQYEEWLRTQPYYNPLLSQMFSGATTWSPILSSKYGIGAGGGAAAGAASGIGDLLSGLSSMMSSGSQGGG